jgi:hypothetical protein
MSKLSAFFLCALFGALVVHPAVGQQNRSLADRVMAYVADQEIRYVRQSTGLSASQCFTDSDLVAFRDQHRAQKIAEALSRSSELKEIVTSFRVLAPDQRDVLLVKVRLVARPTWREVGFIDPRGRFQTEAGHSADLLVAASIADLIAGSLAGS